MSQNVHIAHIPIHVLSKKLWLENEGGMEIIRGQFMSQTLASTGIEKYNCSLSSCFLVLPHVVGAWRNSTGHFDSCNMRDNLTPAATC